MKTNIRSLSFLANRVTSRSATTQGRKEGRKEGIDEGVERGRKEGRKEGKKEGIFTIAKKMLQKKDGHKFYKRGNRVANGIHSEVASSVDLKSLMTESY